MAGDKYLFEPSEERAPAVAQLAAERQSSAQENILHGRKPERKSDSNGITRSHPQIASLAGSATMIDSPQTSLRASAAGLLKSLPAAAALFAAAAFVRVAVLYLVTGTDAASLGWFMDTFHHWQVAFLSKDIGFEHGFLRLWDFKGMEFFWGLLHPLVLAGLFAVTGSIDILVPRLMTVVTGSLTACFLFFLVRRYFGAPAAVAAFLLVAANPVVALADTSGLQEPLGIAILMAGLLLWPKRPVYAGILLGAAGMVRAEYWVFGAGLVLAAIVMELRNYRSWALALGWAIPTVLYMKYMLDYTGNPIYPVYWYFLGDAVGHWMGEGAPSTAVTAARWVSRAALPVLGVAALWVLRKRRPYALLFLLGIGELLFLSVVFGFTAFGRGFMTVLLLDRIFLLPHLFLGVFLSILFVSWLGGRSPKSVMQPLGWIVILGILAGAQLLWIPIQNAYGPSRGAWEQQVEAADALAALHQGGVISIPENVPAITYVLASKHGIPAEGIQGQMYDPFSGMQGDPFQTWSATEAELQEWLVREDIRLLAFYPDKQNYQEMVLRMPTWFEYQGSILNGQLVVYRVRFMAPDALAG
jgi:hypothetical protein